MLLQTFLDSACPSAVIFMSGQGTNAEKLLSSPHYGKKWTCCAIVTDRPETSAARKLSDQFHIPFVEADIFDFYRNHGLESIAMNTEKGRAVRELWTDSLREKIRPFHPGFGILAGFVPLSNIVGDFPCLNVHPGDLTVEENGQRILAGLHYGPVETAILRGFPCLRSSVIIARPYSNVSDADAGYILGISSGVPVILPEKITQDELHRIYKERVPGKMDMLRKIAMEHVERLKQYGDWIVFPSVLEAFVSGMYRHDSAGVLYWKTANGFIPVKTIEFNGKTASVKEI